MTTRLTISAMQWTRVADLRDVAPLNDADLACMRELRDVLARHGRLDRFALHLVHRHFALAAHEVLVEISDPQARVQRLSVHPRASPELVDAVPTTWTLAGGHAEVHCVCAWRGGLGHLGRHALR